MAAVVVDIEASPDVAVVDLHSCQHKQVNRTPLPGMNGGVTIPPTGEIGGGG